MAVVVAIISFVLQLLMWLASFFAITSHATHSPIAIASATHSNMLCNCLAWLVAPYWLLLQYQCIIAVAFAIHRIIKDKLFRNTQHHCNCYCNSQYIAIVVTCENIAIAPCVHQSIILIAFADHSILLHVTVSFQSLFVAHGKHCNLLCNCRIITIKFTDHEIIAIALVICGIIASAFASCRMIVIAFATLGGIASAFATCKIITIAFADGGIIANALHTIAFVTCRILAIAYANWGIIATAISVCRMIVITFMASWKYAKCFCDL